MSVLRNNGMITVELLLAFFLWAVFLTGIVSLWFALFGPNIPLFEYADQENFFVFSTNGMGSGTPRYILRDVTAYSGSGLDAIWADWKNGFGQKTCRGIDTDHLVPVGQQSPIVLDGLNAASAMLVRGNKIYLATNSSSTTDPDLYILSIAEKANPTIVSKMDTGPGLAAISAAGYMLYVANTSVNSQAQAFDISDATNPKMKWSFKVPGSQGTSTALGKAIVSNGDRVFLGTAKNASQEIFSLEAETGQLLVGQEMSAGVNGLFLDNSLLYAASPIDPELLIFDVSNRSLIRQVAQYDAPGGSGNGKSIEIVNDDIYFGRTLGGNELARLRNDKAIPSIVKMNDAKIGATVDAILAAENTLFVLTGHSQKELQVWRVGHDQSQLALMQTIDLPARAVAIGCSGKYIYVAQGTHIPLLIFKQE